MPSYGDLAVSPALPPNLPGPQCSQTESRNGNGGNETLCDKVPSRPPLPCSVQGPRHGFLISEGEGDFGSPDKQEKEFACIHYKTPWPVTTLTLVGGGVKTGTRPQRHQDSSQREHTYQ